MEEGLPPGFRFHPTDEELITYYLSRKVSDFAFSTRAIADVDLNKCEPWDLPSKSIVYIASVYLRFLVRALPSEKLYKSKRSSLIIWCVHS